MTPAGFYSVFFRGSQAPQGRPGRFFCSAWPEEGDPGKAARRSGPCGRCLPGGPGAALPFRGRPGMDTARIRQKSAPGKTTRATGTARCPRPPAACREPLPLSPGGAEPRRIGQKPEDKRQPFPGRRRVPRQSGSSRHGGHAPCRRTCRPQKRLDPGT